MTAQLDHIVILLPYPDIVNPPTWITDKFTIAPGGRHGDNKTENKIIVFADGSYLELIAFIDDDPKHREGHWWGDKGFGVIDFALTLKEGPSAFPALMQKLQKLHVPDAWKPQDLNGGSRIKPDGERIEWQVAFPQGSARGKVPFWCFDVTPRDRRVTSDPKLTRHPSGAKGVGAILESLHETDFEGVRAYLDAVLPKISDTKNFTYGSVKPIDGFSQPRISLADIVSQEKAESTTNGRQLVAQLKIFADSDVDWAIYQDVEGDVISISRA